MAIAATPKYKLCFLLMCLVPPMIFADITGLIVCLDHRFAQAGRFGGWLFVTHVVVLADLHPLTTEPRDPLRVAASRPPFPDFSKSGRAARAASRTWASCRGSSE